MERLRPKSMQGWTSNPNLQKISFSYHIALYHPSIVFEVTLSLDLSGFPRTISNVFFSIRQNPDERREVGWCGAASKEDTGYSHKEVPSHAPQLERPRGAGHPPHRLCDHCHGPWHTEGFQQQLSGDPDLPISLWYLWTDNLLCVSFSLLTERHCYHASWVQLIPSECQGMLGNKELKSHSTWFCQRNGQFDLLWHDKPVPDK